MTKQTHLNPEFLVATVSQLQALFPPAHPVALAKSLHRLDKHACEFIARSPFLCIGTQSSVGMADVSPRGDPAGFVKVLDDRTLLIPDRPGNNRLDTQSNILTNPAVGLLFMIPGFDDTLRINGTAQITRDPALLAQLAVNNRLPVTAIIVIIQEVFLHCAKAFRRAKLWDPEQRQDRSEMPSLLRIINDQTAAAPTSAEEQEKIDAGLEESYRRTMY